MHSKRLCWYGYGAWDACSLPTSSGTGTIPSTMKSMRTPSPMGDSEYPPRSLKCLFGELTYWRSYYERTSDRGCFPLDIALGLFADSFTPKVISLVTRLATQMSYESAHLVCKIFLGWAPAPRTINELVLKLGEHASDYMKEVPPQVRSSPAEIIVVEIDGKATPTATEELREKRRGGRIRRKRKVAVADAIAAKPAESGEVRRNARKKGIKRRTGVASRSWQSTP